MLKKKNMSHETKTSREKEQETTLERYQQNVRGKKKSGKSPACP